MSLVTERWIKMSGSFGGHVWSATLNIIQNGNFTFVTVTKFVISKISKTHAKLKMPCAVKLLWSLLWFLVIVVGFKIPTVRRWLSRLPWKLLAGKVIQSFPTTIIHNDINTSFTVNQEILQHCCPLVKTSDLKKAGKTLWFNRPHQVINNGA